MTLNGQQIAGDRAKLSIANGEKARLALYKLMLEETNFLILDEPTNHLDFDTREIVERALLKYQGTLLIVSHDRHFLDVLAERVLEIRDGILYDYPGNYSWFLEKREENLTKIPENLTPVKKSENKNSQAVNNFQVKQELKELKKNLSQCEKKISDSETRLNEIDAALCEPETLKDGLKVKNLMIERDNLDKEIQNLYSDWENLSLKIEELNEKISK